MKIEIHSVYKDELEEILTHINFKQIESNGLKKFECEGYSEEFEEAEEFIYSLFLAEYCTFPFQYKKYSNTQEYKKYRLTLEEIKNDK